MVHIGDMLAVIIRPIKQEPTQMSDDKTPGHIDRLLKIMNQLRDPDTGCPWDLEQDFSTIVPYTIEEAYEVADAIERQNLDDLKDELGDLLLQVVFHSQMASEIKAFEFGDVVTSICDKMVRRHPHVFYDDTVKPGMKDAASVKGSWEQIKALERADASDHVEGSSNVFLNVPTALPGLTRAVKLQKRAANVGFDWPDVAPVFDKVTEETNELREAVNEGDRDQIMEEFGDLLFSVANLARHLEIDPERALRGANAKFVRRFEAVEIKLTEQGATLEQSDLAGMEAMWNEVKRDESDEDK